MWSENVFQMSYPIPIVLLQPTDIYLFCSQVGKSHASIAISSAHRLPVKFIGLCHQQLEHFSEMNVSVGELQVNP